MAFALKLSISCGLLMLQMRQKIKLSSLAWDARGIG